MTTSRLKIHSENILPIIKKWLYSDKDIFARELVSNANDALQKLKILKEQGLAPCGEGEFRISVRIDKQAKTLTFSDTGIGMDAEEVEKYIAQIAFSGAEEFVSAYRSDRESDQFIGHFGLGFYSAYMVAKRVEIETLSYKEGAEPVFWSCDGSSEYLLEKGEKKERGTDIILHISEENEEFLEEPRLRGILENYCSFLPYPIYLGEARLNEREPLWLKAPSDCSERDYLEFYRHLYPFQEDPLFWVHINVDYPFHVKGILYFPKLSRRFDAKKHAIKLFCNRVFVSDDCKEIIPEYLMPLKGVIDSPDIPLNVSRSYLQMDSTVRGLAKHISKKVADSLAGLYKADRERYIACWREIGPIVKVGALEDEKFYERVKSLIIWKNSREEWTTIDSYLEANREKSGEKILYAPCEGENRALLEIYREKGIDVLFSDHPVDPYLFSFLEGKLSPVKIRRIDAELNDHLLDPSKEKTLLDPQGRTEAAKLADFIRGSLETNGVEVEAKSLASSIPALITIDEEARRMREYMRSLDQTGALQQGLGKKTFIVNTNSQLMLSIQKLQVKNPELAKDLVNEIYELSQLNQNEMDREALQGFVRRTGRVLEGLTKELL